MSVHDAVRYPSPTSGPRSGLSINCQRSAMFRARLGRKMLRSMQKTANQLPRAFCARLIITVCALVAACIIAAQIVVLPSVLQDTLPQEDILPLRVVCVADTHGRHEGLRLLEGDVLIMAGDLLPANADQKWVVEFNKWLGERKYEHKFVVPGNMDIWISQHPQRARELLSNAILLVDEAREFFVRDRRYSIFGSPWTPEFTGVYQLPSGSLLDAAAIWQRIPQQLDILVTHGPPRGTLDVNAYGQHIGDRVLAQAIEHARPRLHVFGHTHDSAGRVKKGGIMFVNGAQVRNLALGQALPIVAELPPTPRRWLRAVPTRNPGSAFAN